MGWAPVAERGATPRGDRAGLSGPCTGRKRSWHRVLETGEWDREVPVPMLGEEYSELRRPGPEPSCTIAVTEHQLSVGKEGLLGSVGMPWFSVAQSLEGLLRRIGTPGSLWALEPWWGCQRLIE